MKDGRNEGEPCRVQSESDGVAAAPQPDFLLGKGRTHPSPAGSTRPGAVSRQTRPPRSACAGRSPHRASRSSYSSSGTGERTSAAYSWPGVSTGSSVRPPQHSAELVAAAQPHRIVVGVSLFVDDSRQPDHRDDGVQDERQEEVFVEGNPLTAETPEDNRDTLSRRLYFLLYFLL